MKGLYVIAIAFLAYWTATTATITEKKDKIITKCIYNTNETIHLAHETNCAKFYKCYPPNGMRAISCLKDKTGRPLHFNMFKQVCDWQTDAGCIYCPFNGYPLKLPHPSGSCRKYYKCVNLKPKLRRCPSGRCFSRTCQACVKHRKGGKCKK